MLVFTDGACLRNGAPDARAAWAFIDGADPRDQAHSVSGRLERIGPFGDAGKQTSNRAELRAVLAVLAFRAWWGEGFHSMVIATDSEYVVKGITERVQNWISRGWRTVKGTPVVNRDYWEALLGETERLHSQDVALKFWRIPRDLNHDADAAARSAANQPAEEVFTRVHGLFGY